MSTHYKFITESNRPNFNAIKDVIINESKDASGVVHKYVEIAGPFMQCNVTNRNGRIYPREVMEVAVSKYKSDRMSGHKFRSYGALDHPTDLTVALAHVSHITTELRWDNDDIYGRAKILDTEMGRIAESIIRADGLLGVSSRGMGALNQPSEKNPTLYESFRRRFGESANIVTDFELVAIDIVADPSAPDSYVDGILESKQFILTGGQYTESSYRATDKAFRTLSEGLKTLPKKDVNDYVLKQVDNFLSSVGKNNINKI
jgi:hypothetical protein